MTSIFIISLLQFGISVLYEGGGGGRKKERKKERKKKQRQNKKFPICMRNNISSENNYNKIFSSKEYRELTDVNRIAILETNHSTLHSDL
jgi:hypothetical protein